MLPSIKDAEDNIVAEDGMIEFKAHPFSKENFAGVFAGYNKSQCMGVPV